jgi:hypothetical protein
MRRFFSSVFRLRAKSPCCRTRPAPRHRRLSVEPLEERLVLDGGGLLPAALVQAPPGNQAVVAPAPQAASIGGLSGEIGASPTEVLDPANDPAERDRAMGLPFLDSTPDAPVTLYLDFTGNFEAAFSNNRGDFPKPGRPIVTPAFDTNSDPANFSPDERDQITQIWEGVAEDFAPFNINVTTHYYGEFNDGQALKVAIGGLDTDWYVDLAAGEKGAGGTSNIGSFNDSAAPNVVFVFAQEFGKNSAALATAVSHESGHAFGLLHHSRWSADGNLIDEYDSGGPGWTPIMGFDPKVDRTTWDAGPTDEGPDTFQDDLAVLGRPANGFGFRADDHGDTPATATPLTLSLTVRAPLTGKGIINDWKTDADFFKFTSPGGAIQVTVEAPGQTNLIPVAELWSDSGSIARADAGGLTQSIIDANVPAGTYYVRVKGFGDYGDEGQYTVTVNLPSQVLTQEGTTASVTLDSGISRGTTSTTVAVQSGAGLKLKAVAVKVKGLWQVQVLDAGNGAPKFVQVLPKSLRSRPDVRILDLNGDGHDDLLITWKLGKKKGRLSIDGLTGSLLFNN